MTEPSPELVGWASALPGFVDRLIKSVPTRPPILAIYSREFALADWAPWEELIRRYLHRHREVFAVLDPGDAWVALVPTLPTPMVLDCATYRYTLVRKKRRRAVLASELVCAGPEDEEGRLHQAFRYRVPRVQRAEDGTTTISYEHPKGEQSDK